MKGVDVHARGAMKAGARPCAVGHPRTTGPVPCSRVEASMNHQLSAICKRASPSVVCGYFEFEIAKSIERNMGTRSQPGSRA